MLRFYLLMSQRKLFLHYKQQCRLDIDIESYKYVIFVCWLTLGYVCVCAQRLERQTLFNFLSLFCVLLCVHRFKQKDRTSTSSRDSRTLCEITTSNIESYKQVHRAISLLGIAPLEAARFLQCGKFSWCSIALIAKLKSQIPTLSLQLFCLLLNTVLLVKANIVPWFRYVYDWDLWPERVPLRRINIHPFASSRLSSLFLPYWCLCVCLPASMLVGFVLLEKTPSTSFWNDNDISTQLVATSEGNSINYSRSKP